jgi:hypothetical protein
MEMWRTQLPHRIDVALERGKTKPRLDYPPTRFFGFSGPAFHEGIETHELGGVPSRLQSPYIGTTRVEVRPATSSFSTAATSACP